MLVHALPFRIGDIVIYFIGFSGPVRNCPSYNFVNFELQDFRSLPNPQTGLVASGLRILEHGVFLDPDRVPKAVRVVGQSRPLDYQMSRGASIVSERFKYLVETLEPGVHQFFPMDMIRAARSIGTCYLWNICNERDSVDRALTSYKLVKGVKWRTQYEEAGCEIKIEDPKLVFNLDQIGQAGFWRDRKLSPTGIYASETAGRKLLAAGVTGLGGSLRKAV